MQPWIAATLAGLGLGLAFYGCVRLRMHYGHIVRERFGNGARKAYWVVTILFMVFIANAALYGLRLYFASLNNLPSYLLPEIWFVAIAVALALTLIYRRMTRHKR